MLAAFLTCLLIGADALPPDAVIVAPRELMPALQALIKHREQQGHRFAYVAPSNSPVEIRAAIRQAAAAGGLKYVLIVGDAEPAARQRNAAEGVPYSALSARCVPAPLVPAVVNVKWGSEPHIASDNWY